MNLEQWENKIREQIREIAKEADAAHDFLHFERVVNTAKQLALQEGASLDIVIPAAWMHDFVIVPKNDPRRKMASRLSAEAAAAYLKTIEFPSAAIEKIAHAIEAHSFSAGIEAKSLEAKVVQDADRLDGIGAIGIARCFATGGALNRAFYSDEDPFCESRKPEDSKFTIDHFYQKLFLLEEKMQTKAGRAEAKRRTEVMKVFLAQLKEEIVPARSW